MARTRTYLRSFAGGELSPDLLGRSDDIRFQTAVRSMPNMIPTPRGPARKRHGLGFVDRTLEDKRCRLLPFRFSGDDTMLVALMLGTTRNVFRWFSNGLPVLYADTRVVAEVDPGTDELRFLGPHGFLAGQLVRVFSIDSGGVLPAATPALTDQTIYTIDVVDAFSLKLKDGATPVDLTDAGTGVLRLLPSAQTPRNYIASQNFTTDFATNPNYVDFASAHERLVGDRVTLTNTGGALPTPLEEGRIYYVMNVVDTDTLRLALEDGGAAIDFSDNGTGTHRLHQYYEQGDQVYLRTTGKGFYICNIADPQDNTPTSPTFHWHRMGDDGELELPSPYLEAQLPRLGFTQSENKLWIVHEDFDLGSLERLSATSWKFNFVSVTPPLPAPTGLQGATTRGARFAPVSFDYFGGAPGSDSIRFAFNGGHSFSNGEGVYLEGFVTTIPELPNGFYTAATRAGVGSPDRELLFRTLAGTMITSTTAAGSISGATVESTGLVADLTNTYVVTTLDRNRVESVKSSELILSNNLLIAGTKNTLSWDAVAGAERYRVYRKVNGLFGYIGETDALTFIDSGPIQAQFDVTPPILDTSATAGKPRAVAVVEQRLAIGGMAAEPQKCVLSSTAAEQDFSYHIPVRADDRISFRTTLDGSPVRHLLPMPHGLLVLTSSAELLLEAIGDEALAPETIRLRTLSQKGSSVTPAIVLNDHAVFTAQSGSHPHIVRLTARGSETVDIGIRSNHLFDDYSIADMTGMRSPFPMLVGARSDGTGLFGILQPEEEVLGWSRFTTFGEVENACALTEGMQDVVYLVVKNGSERSIQRLPMSGSTFLDDSLAVNGTNQTATTVTIGNGIGWGPADVLTLVSSTPLPLLIGDRVDVLAADGTWVGLSVLAFTSALVWQVRATSVVPADIRTVATTAWRHARTRVLTHRVSAAVTVVADGVVVEATTDSTGYLTLATPAIEIAMGRRYSASIVSLPIVLPTDLALGRGFTWNIERVFLGVTGGVFKVGPSATDTETRTPTQEQERIAMPGEWTDAGQVVIVSEEPFPLDVLYIAMEVAAS